MDEERKRRTDSSSQIYFTDTISRRAGRAPRVRPAALAFLSFISRPYVSLLRAPFFVALRPLCVCLSLSLCLCVSLSLMRCSSFLPPENSIELAAASPELRSPYTRSFSPSLRPPRTAVDLLVSTCPLANSLMGSVKLGKARPGNQKNTTVDRSEKVQKSCKISTSPPN